MKNVDSKTDPRKSEKKTPPDTDTIPQEFPDSGEGEEFIGEKSDWSEDVSEIKKKK